MDETQRGYVSYLLRMWPAEDNGDWVWRASLESSDDGQLWIFANLNELIAFVTTQTENQREIENPARITKEESNEV